jgi:ribonuclease E
VLDNDPTTTNDDAATAEQAAAPPEATSQNLKPETPRGTTPDTDDTPEAGGEIATDKPAKKTAAKKAAKAPAKKAAAKKTAAKKTAKTAASESGDETGQPVQGEATQVAVDAPAEKPKKKAAPRKKAAAKNASSDQTADAPTVELAGDSADAPSPAAAAPPMVLFQAPEPTAAPARKRAAKKTAAKADTPAETSIDAPSDTATAADEPATVEAVDGDETAGPSEGGGSGRNRGRGQGRGAQGGNRGQGGRNGQDGGRNAKVSDDTDEDAPVTDAEEQDDSDDENNEGEGGARRRRRRGGRRRRKPSDGENGDTGENGDEQSDDSEDSDDANDSDGDNEGTGSRRRRRRRRSGDDGDSSDDSGNNAPRARKQRNPEDEITSIGGSTRLEAKKQRRREGREAGRRRAPIVSEAEFLARREAVDRVMVIRQKDDLTQIGVLEDKVLVEHYVARESQTSLIGNVYLGRVQNVLPSMEAAFVDIGKGRNAVLYAGEVNWAAVGHKDGQQRKIESVLSAGQTILVQVSKDPVGHKGARLTGQVSLPGRFLVYVPDGNTSGISRKLPDTERNRLKTLLKQIVPDSAGVIVRTAAEGATEEELTLDVERLTARWADIEEKVKAGKSPQLLYGEPDLTLKVVRDLFTEDFGKLVVQGDDAWDLVENYVSHVAPDLKERLERFEPGQNGKDLFATYRVDEQIAKGLDRKVWLPSGGSLIIDRTEAMTVVDVNTGKFTGSGGNLEETVTKNNLEAAEEMVRQLRLRDIGGIIVIDFIDMVLESNRDLVLRRLVECLGRDRTRHQVAEVTSLGLVQMTRKRIGTGLVEAFSTDCEHCKGRGLVVHDHPIESGPKVDDDDARGRGRGRSGRNRGRGGDDNGGNGGNGGGAAVKPSPADLANTRPPEKQPEDSTDELETTDTPAEKPAQEPVEQAVIGRPTGSVPEPQDVPSESAATPEPETQSEPEPEPTPTPVAEAPRVVASTRRRTARRPAGPPSPLTGAAPIATGGKQASPSGEPVDVPVERAPGHVHDSLPEERVPSADVTATEAPVATPDPQAEDESEGTAHGDPTWPSEDSVGDAEGSEGDAEGEDGDEGDDESGNGLSLVHVPIKRKGSRKR